MVTVWAWSGVTIDFGGVKEYNICVIKQKWRGYEPKLYGEGRIKLP
jgi:hypothetical protein